MKIPRITLFIPLALGSVLPNSGCTSMSSTFMQRQEDDQLLGISNGKSGTHNHARPFKGIPVKLKVPSHIDISIEETLLVTDTNNSLKVQQLGSGTRQLNVAKSVVYSDKVFTVDLKRPAAGTVDYELQFDKQAQYFKEINYKNVDETIKDITTVISSLTPISKPKGTPVGAGGADSQARLKETESVVKEIHRTIAWKRFDLQDPMLEDQIASFVSVHLQEDQNCNLIQSDEHFLNSAAKPTSTPVQIQLSDRKIQPSKTAR